MTHPNQQQRGWGWKRHRSSCHAQNRSAFSALFGEPTFLRLQKAFEDDYLRGRKHAPRNSLEKSTRPDRKPSSTTSLLRHRFVPQPYFKTVCDSIFFRQPTRVDHPLRQFSF